LKLKELTTIRTGLVLSRKKASLHNNFKKNYKQITLKSFSNTTTLLPQYFDTFISNEEIKDEYISQIGDIVVRLREPNIAVHIDEESEGMIIPSLMAIVRVKSEKIDKEYLANYLNSTNVKRALQMQVKGTTIAMIKTKDLEDIEVVIPTMLKQKSLVKLLKSSQEELQLLNQLKEQKENFALSVLDTVINKTKRG
jgi:restriction endonuclease S subunit